MDLTYQAKISLANFILSGLAIFSLKYPSLLQYDEDRSNPIRRYNLKSLFHIDEIPSDTTMRERLDEPDPSELRPLYTQASNSRKWGISDRTARNND